MSEADYDQDSVPVMTTTSSTISDVGQNIEIKFLNVLPQQIFNSDIELRVEILSSFGIEEKTLYLNNNYVGELTLVNGNIYAAKVSKDNLWAENELKVRVADNHLNILEKSITILSETQ
ncbi:MAG: hypothetical protein WC422_00025 [Candidatus Paceibacterota bacterium]